MTATIDVVIGGVLAMITICVARIMQEQRDLIRTERFQRMKMEHLATELQRLKIENAELRTRIEMMKNGAPYR